MPRASHRGCLFAVSGRVMTAFGRRRKRGLYHHCTNEIFRPSWGPVRQPGLMLNSNLPNWSSDALSPADKLPPKPQYHRDARMAWPMEKPIYIANVYHRNVQRYLRPVEAANDDHIRRYIYNVLDTTYRKSYHAAAPSESHKAQDPPKHIHDILRSVNAVSTPSVDLKQRHGTLPVFRRLESLIRHSDSWRTIAPLQESCANPFPHVNESASLVRNLPLSEILHTRSNHRLARRAHPKWYTARYLKFRDKKALQEKLMQLKLETGT